MSETPPLSPEEEDACLCVGSNRANLGRFIDEFSLAVLLFEVLLFEFLERGGGPPSVGVFGGVFVQFRIVAAKEGALAIFHFAETLRALRKMLPMCPTAKGSVDLAKVRSALGVFEKRFPHVDNTRHGVAHAGEVWKNPKAMRLYQQRKDYCSDGGFVAAGGWLTSGLHDRTFSVSWGGDVFVVQMDHSTTNTLLQVRSMVEAAFLEPLIRTLHASPPS